MRFPAILQQRASHVKAAIKPHAFNRAQWITTNAGKFGEEAPIVTSQAALRLRSAFAQSGSDKSTGHDYHIPYARLLDTCPSGPILEIGIGSIDTTIASNMGAKGTVGASLRAWRALQRFSHVYGADIDPATMLDEPGISTRVLNQLDPTSLLLTKEQLLSIEPLGFSLIVDDGLHTAEANINSLEALFPLVKPSGYFVIEDISSSELGKIMKFLHDKSLSSWLLWTNVARRQDNQMLVISRSS